VYEIIMYGILAIILVVLSVMDIVNRKILIWLPAIAAASRLAYLMFTREYQELIKCSIGAAVVIGTGLVLTRVTEGAVGEGDAWVCGTVIFHMGCIDGITAIIAAFILAAVYSAALIMIKRADRKHMIPFVPFICAGYIITSGCILVL